MIKLLLFVILLSSCSSQKCDPQPAEKIDAIMMVNNTDTSYSHEIFVEGLSRSCDSLTVMNIISKYIHDSNSDLPIAHVEVFNSKENYDPGETLSQPQEFWGDCIVGVWLDRKTGIANEFNFYNTSGRQIYKGIKWSQ